MLETGQPADALRLAKSAIAGQETERGLYYLTAQCYRALSRYDDMYEALQAEIARDPHHPATEELKAWAPYLQRDQTTRSGNDRSYSTSLDRVLMHRIQKACHAYRYRGVKLIKNPFDFAIYPMIIWDLQPRTIFEIGSQAGGSAIWFGDLLENFGIDGSVHSIDVVKVTDVSHPRVTFYEGNGRALGETFSPKFLECRPRPWLVIEDADHSYETTSAALQFFHPFLKKGDFIAIEDGIISDLTDDSTYSSGPHLGIKEFLANFPEDYEIEARYCDFFGYNVTWCTNGFLRVTKPPAATE